MQGTPKDETDRNDLAIAGQAITINTLKKFVGTPAIPKRWKNMSEIIAGIKYGEEIGLLPMTSLQVLYVVGGGVAMMGKAMAALITARGHVLVLDEMSAKRGAVTAMRRDPYTHELLDIGTFEFTWEDAEKAGLDKEDTYQDYPKDMLMWRAVSRCAKLAFPEVITGILLPEEIGGDFAHIPAEEAALIHLDEVLDVEEIE